MALTYGLSTVCDLFTKLQRDAALLEEEVTSDRLFNFVVTGYSMIDWIENDPSVPAQAKERSFIDGLYGDRWINVCGELSNASKHFSLKKRELITASTSSERGFGFGRYGKGDYGAGEESIQIELNNGTSFHCLDLMRGVLSTWKAFFAAHKIEVDQRTEDLLTT